MQRFLVTLLCALCIAVELSAKGQVLITPATTTVQSGSTFNLNVNITGVTDLYALQFDVSFMPTILSATTVSEGAFLPGGGSTFFAPGTIDNLVGTITITADTLIGALSGVSGSGNLAGMKFTAQAAGSSAIKLSNILLLDSNLNDIPTSALNGTVTVTPAAPVVPEPSAISMMFAIACTVACFVLPRRNLQRHV